MSNPLTSTNACWLTHVRPLQKVGPQSLPQFSPPAPENRLSISPHSAPTDTHIDHPGQNNMQPRLALTRSCTYQTAESGKRSLPSRFVLVLPDPREMDPCSTRRCPSLDTASTVLIHKKKRPPRCCPTMRVMPCPRTSFSGCIEIDQITRLITE